MWEFGNIARNLLHGNGYSYTYYGTSVVSAFMPPALGYIYYFFFRLFGDNPTAYFLILVFNSIIAGLCVIVIFKIAELMFDFKIALISVLYFMLSPVYLYSAINFNSIVIYHILIGLLLLNFLKIYRDNNNRINKYVIYLGIIFGLSFFVRGEFILLMLFVTSLLLINKRIKYAFTIFFISLIILSPWTYRNYVVFRKFIPVTTSFGTNFYFGHSHYKYDSTYMKFNEETVKDSAYELKVSDFAFNRSVYFIKNYPAEELREAASKIFCLWFIDKYRENAANPIYILTWMPTLLLFIIGYFKSLKMKEVKNKLKFLNVYLLCSTILVIIFFNIPRYQIQMSYTMIPVSMFGFYTLYKLIFKKTSI